MIINKMANYNRAKHATMITAIQLVDLMLPRENAQLL
jgi:hypothetical protein